MLNGRNACYFIGRFYSMNEVKMVNTAKGPKPSTSICVTVKKNLTPTQKQENNQAQGDKPHPVNMYIWFSAFGNTVDVINNYIGPGDFVSIMATYDTYKGNDGTTKQTFRLETIEKIHECRYDNNQNNGGNGQYNNNGQGYNNGGYNNGNQGNNGQYNGNSQGYGGNQGNNGGQQGNYQPQGNQYGGQQGNNAQYQPPGNQPGNQPSQQGDFGFIPDFSAISDDDLPF